MIDTVRFRIQLDERQYSFLRAKSLEVSQRDNASHTTIFRILRNQMPLGSYDRNVNIFVNDDAECFLEFSVPKFVMGHNLYMVYPEAVPEILEALFLKLKKFFGDFPAPLFWELMRVDLCYAWKLRNHDVAVKVMELLQKLEVPRKHKASYRSSVMYKGSDMSIKFYLKDDEFYAHDFKELRKIGHWDLAYELYNLSTGILRYEVTLRKRQINRLFFGTGDGEIFWHSEVFTTQLCTIILNGYLMSLLRGQHQAATLDVVCDRLVEKYGHARGFHLYGFYKVYFGEDNGRTKILKHMDRTTVWRNLKYLQKADVGITISELPEDFDLTIPSSNVVNEFSRSAPTGAHAIDPVV